VRSQLQHDQHRDRVPQTSPGPVQRGELNRREYELDQPDDPVLRQRELVEHTRGDRFQPIRDMVVIQSAPAAGGDSQPPVALVFVKLGFVVPNRSARTIAQSN
jgi:hypothetical protein